MFSAPPNRVDSVASGSDHGSSQKQQQPPTIQLRPPTQSPPLRITSKAPPTVQVCGQSYKASKIVIYDSRVVPDLKIPHIMTLEL